MASTVLSSSSSSFLLSSSSSRAQLRQWNSGSTSSSCPPRRHLVSASHSNESAHVEEGRGGLHFARRDLFLAAGSLMLVQPSEAADLIQRSQRGEFLNSIKGKLQVAIKANPDIVQPLLRLALNDAATYDKALKSGGANGSIRFSSELSRPENEGLAVAVKFLEGLKEEIDAEAKAGPISWADLIQFAGQMATKRTFLEAAIKKCGGKEDKGLLLYSAYGSSGQWSLFDKQFGRSDASEPDPEGKLMKWEDASVSDIKARFEKLGLKARQVAVMSAFLGSDQLKMEAKLATDPEVAPWVQKYQRSRETVSQTDYEVDLITSLAKLSTLGQAINYEAYTYKPKALKLKL